MNYSCIFLALGSTIGPMANVLLAHGHCHIKHSTTSILKITYKLVQGPRLII